MTSEANTGQPRQPFEGSSADSGSYLYVGDALGSSEVLRQIENLLCYKGGRIHTARTHTDARVILENANIRTVLIDQYLDQGSGIDFMRWVHSVSTVPAIIVVLATESISIETIVALEAGASDAVPVNIPARELAARIHACTRKYFLPPVEFNESAHLAHARAGQSQHHNPLYFSPHNHNLYFADSSKVVLSTKEAALLELLARHYPGFVTREQISVEIYHRSWNPNDRSVDNLVSRLRKSIDARECEPGDSIIETLRNEGYRLRSAIGLLPAEQSLSAMEKARLESILKRS